jgi:hypothetical protein
MRSLNCKVILVIETSICKTELLPTEKYAESKLYEMLCKLQTSNVGVSNSLFSSIQKRAGVGLIHQ